MTAFAGQLVALHRISPKSHLVPLDGVRTGRYSPVITWNTQHKENQVI
ncbi:hypothetical protein Nmel_007839 [Mimus melanotis]